jgi:small conductance mechanosensitive channel
MALAEILQWLKALLMEVYTNFVVAIIILLVGVLLGRLAGKLVQQLLHELEADRFMKKTAHVKVSVEEIIANFTTYFIYFVTIIMALDQLGITTTVLQIISIAIIIIIIASILLGLRDFIPNLISGLYIHQKRILDKGDIIRVGDLEGEVVDFNLVETRIKTAKQDIIYIPNAILTKKEVIKLKK